MIYVCQMELGIYLVHVCLDVLETNEMFINVADWSPRTARQNSRWEKKLKLLVM